MSLESEIKKQKAKNRQLQKNGQPQEVYTLIKDYPENNEPPKGEKYCKCQKCGKVFEQVLSIEKNVYSSFKTCPACRKIKSDEQMEKIKKKQEKEVNVAKLPYTPYEWQLEAHEAFENHRFIVLACGNRCFTADAFINGCDKPISEVRKGDFVLNKNGELIKVTHAESEEYSGNIYSVKAVGCEEINCTETHPICVAEIDNGNVVKETYAAVEDIKSRVESGKNLYLKMPRIKGSIKCDFWGFERFDKNYKNQLDGIPINPDTAWMLGLYCAEGCFLDKAGCKFTLNYNEPELAEKLCNILDDLQIHYNLRERPEEGTRCIIVTKMQFCRKLDFEIGHGAENKRIPASILYNKNEDILLSFLKGYYAGDGYFNAKAKILQSTTVSKTLSQQIQTAWCRIGVLAKITSFQRNIKRTKQNGEIGKCSREYTITINDADYINKLGYSCVKKKHKPTYYVKPDSIYTKVNSVSVSQQNTTVYFISTYDESLSCFNTLNGNTGKDRFSMMALIKYFVECLNENRQIDAPDMVPPVYGWILAPTERLARQNWRELRQYFPKEWVVACSDSSYQMETIGGGVLEVRSAYSPSELVGVGLDIIVATEASQFKDLNLAWANLEARLNSPGRGRAIDRAGHKYGQGKAIINSTPDPNNSKNFFYEMFCYGQPTSDLYSSLWWSCQFPWTRNPANAELAKSIIHSKYGDITYEENLRRRIGERNYRTLYLADFNAATGSVFNNFDVNCVVNPFVGEMATDEKKRKEFIDNWKSVKPLHNYVGGYDPATGSSGDSPAFVIRDLVTNEITRVYDLYGKNYEAQWDFIASICKMFNNAPIYWLRTGHTAIEGQFQKRGIYEVPIDENGNHKSELIQKLVLAVENGDIHVLNDNTMETQTLIFQMQDYTETNGKFSNKSQPHDDFVSALYAAFSDYVIADIPVSYCGLMGGI